MPPVKIQNTDMPNCLVEEAISVSDEALKRYCVDIDVAQFVKTHFDGRHGLYWNCIVGNKFGVYVTHHECNFVHFYLGNKAVVLFKGL